MSGVRFAVLAAVSAFVLALGASAAAAGTGTGTGTGKSSGNATSGGGSSTSACLAHIPGGLSVDENDLSEYYTSVCTGHDEPELDPVSSAPGSAQDITWHVQLPADGGSR